MRRQPAPPSAAERREALIARTWPNRPTSPSPRVAGASIDTPIVTVVVPVRDEQSYLQDCLESVRKQTFEGWRCVVVDDGSTDLSLDIAVKFAKKDARFSVVRHDVGRGLSAARNAGADVADTPYLAFLDSDDALLPQSLEARVGALTDDPLQAGAYSDWFLGRWDTPLRDLDPGRKPRKHAATKDLVDTAWDTPFIATSPIVRRDLFLATGGFDESMTTAEDVDFFARLLRGGVHFSYSGSVDVLYRTKPQSMVMRTVDDHLGAIYRVAQWRGEHAQVWEGAPLPCPEPLDVHLRGAALFDRGVGNLALAVATDAPVAQIDAILDHLRELPAQVRRRAVVPSLVRKHAAGALRRLSPGREPDTASVDELAGRVADVLAAAQPTDALAPAPALARREGADDPTGYRAVHVVRTTPVTELAPDRRPFLLVADSRYHVDETGPLLIELRARGVDAEALMITAGEVHRQQLVDWGRYTDRVYVAKREDLDAIKASGCLLLNDWTRHGRRLMDAVRASGGVTFAKVEGVQDFDDVDIVHVEEPRRAYRTADVVLAQGANDERALAGADVRVVGSSRLESIWAQGATGTTSRRALVNVNFTYRVLTEAQEPWVTAVVGALSDAGLDYDVSAHAAQKDLSADPRVQDHLASAPFRHLVTRAGLLVSRFSTVPFEAMARGVPFVYFNPHGEKVPTFAEPDGAFALATDEESLRKAVDTALAWAPDYRSRAEPFFRQQVDIDPERTSAERAADVIVERLRSRS